MHQKNAAALALTAVKNEDQREFAKLVDSFKSQFNEGARVQVGGCCTIVLIVCQQATDIVMCVGGVVGLLSGGGARLGGVLVM